MASLCDRVEQNLNRLAAGAGLDDVFAVGRVQVAGEPTGWREEITFERGQAQTLFRNRSAADQGGASIGSWGSRAEEERTQAIAQALCQARIWTCESESGLPPGKELVTWSCVTRDAAFDVYFSTSSPLMSAFMPADLEMRRIANSLEKTRSGALMRAGLQAQVSGGVATLKIGFVNDGRRRCLFVNPLRFPAGDANYFRVEVAAAPEEVPDETSIGPEFKPVPLELASGASADPWGDHYLTLVPGTSLLLPLAPALEPLPPGAYILRTAYSCYGQLASAAGVPVIQGRAYSNEVPITV